MAQASFHGITPTLHAPILACMDNSQQFSDMEWRKSTNSTVDRFTPAPIKPPYHFGPWEEPYFEKSLPYYMCMDPAQARVLYSSEVTVPYQNGKDFWEVRQNNLPVTEDILGVEFSRLFPPIQEPKVSLGSNTSLELNELHSQNDIRAIIGRKRWTTEEDSLLLNLVWKGMDWREISRHMPGRSKTSCRLHYQQYFAHVYWNEAKKSKLRALYRRFGEEFWRKIAGEMEQERHIPWQEVESTYWRMRNADRPSQAKRVSLPSFAEFCAGLCLDGA